MNDYTILKKKLSTYRSSEGYLVGVSAEVLQELLRAWEQWTGKSKDFYRAIGVSQKQIAFLLGKAKKLKREGHFPAEEFQEIASTGVVAGGPAAPCTGIELVWDGGKIIRFPSVEPLMEFLKKAA